MPSTPLAEVRRERLGPLLLGALLSAVVIGGGGKIPWVWNLASAGLLAAWAYALRRGPASDRFRWSDHPLCPGIAGALLWQLVSWAVSPSWALGFAAVQKTWTLVAFGALVHRYGTSRGSRWFEGILGTLGAAQAVLVLAAWAMNRAPLLLLPGNPLYGALGMSVAALFVFSRALEGSLSRAARGGNALLGAVLLTAVMALRVRSAVLGVTAGLLVILGKRFGRRGLWGGMLLVLIGGVMFPPVSLLKADDALAWSRPAIWRAAVEAIAEHPFFGWGPGRFEEAYRVHAPALDTEPVRFERVTRFAHNDFLQAAADTGAPGAVFWVFTLGFFFFMGPTGARGVAATAAVTTWAVASLFYFPLASPALGLLLAGVAGLAVPARRWPLEAIPPGVGVAVRTGTVAVLVALAAGGAAVAWGDVARRWGGEAFFLSPHWADDRLARAERRLHEQASGVQVGEEERVSLRHVLALYPTRAEAWRLLGHLEAEHRGEPRYPEALTAYGRAISLWPRYAPWRLEMAQVSMGLRDWAAARRTLHQALALEPSYGDAAVALGEVLIRAGEPAIAERWLSGLLRRWETGGDDGGSGYRRAILHRDGVAAVRAWALSRLEQKNYRGALAALALMPAGDEEREVLEAGCYFFLGDRRRAEALLRGVQRRHPTRPGLTEQLRRVHGRP